MKYEDLEAIRKKVEAEQGPEWTAKYGEASWKAALAVIGELHEDDEPTPDAPTPDTTPDK